ncbi:MAG: hypothetical protein ACLGSA_12435 [Acidobacteriota bacterium]
MSLTRRIATPWTRSARIAAPRSRTTEGRTACCAAVLDDATAAPPETAPPDPVATASRAWLA